MNILLDKNGLAAFRLLHDTGRNLERTQHYVAKHPIIVTTRNGETLCASNAGKVAEVNVGQVEGVRGDVLDDHVGKKVYCVTVFRTYSHRAPYQRTLSDLVGDAGRLI